MCLTFGKVASRNESLQATEDPRPVTQFAMFDQFDTLDSLCKKPESYPLTLIRSKTFNHARESYRNGLDEDKDRLFDPNPKYTLVELLEAYDGQHGMLSFCGAMLCTDISIKQTFCSPVARP